MNSNRDVFLSHASEDKSELVFPFAKELEALGISYWLDSVVLMPGDSLTQKIFEGINKSKIVTVFITKNFLGKGWATAELRNALARQIRENRNIVVPYLVDIEFNDLLLKFPEFENIYCGNFNNGFQYAAKQIQKILLSSQVVGRCFLSRSDILNIQNKYTPEAFEKLSALPEESIISFEDDIYSEFIYSYIFSSFSETKIIDLISERIEKSNLSPLESFFQISILSNLSIKSEAFELVSKIYSSYPTPKISDFSHIILPNQRETKFWKKVPKGNFLFGAAEKDPWKKEWVIDHTEVFVDDFDISCVPITNYHYELFYPGNYRNRLKRIAEFDFHPVVNVNWYEAAMFSSWLDRNFGNIYLPTEYQWEKAASWGDKGKFRFPWGNDWDPHKCNSWEENPINSTTRVGSYEEGQSQYGIYDMSGNVWEWCQDWFSDNWSQFLKVKSSNPSGPLSGNRKVDRGGGWYKDVGYPTSHVRAADDPNDRFSHCGFRIVRAHS